MTAGRRKHKDDFIRCAGDVFMSIKRRARTLISDAKTDLTIEQIIVLSILEEGDGLRLKEVAELSDREKTTTTRMIDGLERKNLLVRIPDQNDRRQKLIYLTHEGKKRMAQLEAFKPEVERRMLIGVPDDKVQTAMEVLKRAVENLDDDNLWADSPIPINRSL